MTAQDQTSADASLYAQTFGQATIDAVAPATLTDADIGNPASPGSASLANGIWTVTGGGTGIGGSSDQFNFNSTAVSGDHTIIAQVGSNTPPNVIQLGKANGLYLTHPYQGPTTVQDLNLEIPTGYNVTAYLNSSQTAWVWEASQNWDQSQESQRIFTMCWYPDHTHGWVDMYSNGTCWDWLLTRGPATSQQHRRE